MHSLSMQVHKLSLQPVQICGEKARAGVPNQAACCGSVHRNQSFDNWCQCQCRCHWPVHCDANEARPDDNFSKKTLHSRIIQHLLWPGKVRFRFLIVFLPGASGEFFQHPFSISGQEIICPICSQLSILQNSAAKAFGVGTHMAMSKQSRMPSHAMCCT